MRELTWHLPPKTIYDVLHEAESAGVIIPEDVDSWWKVETDINMSPILMSEILANYD